MFHGYDRFVAFGPAQSGGQVEVRRSACYRTRMPKRTTEETALSVAVHARISLPEKAALDRLIASRAATLRAQGITGQDTFSAWLRAQIRKEAAASGRPVEDTPPEPAPAATSAQKGSKTARK